jgi:hypothetical protein
MIILYYIYFILFIILFTFWFFFLPQHFLRFIPMFRSFLLPHSLQRELLSRSGRRYLFSLCWCWTIIFYLGGIRDGNKVTTIVSNKKGVKSGRMIFLRDGIKILHTIINIPSDGVYFGVCICIYIIVFVILFSCYFPFSTFTQFSSWYSSFAISFTSLRKLRIPPSCIAGDGRQCVGYNFEGGFEDFSLKHQDENGEEIPSIKEYFKY